MGALIWINMLSHTRVAGKTMPIEVMTANELVGLVGAVLIGLALLYGACHDLSRR